MTFKLKSDFKPMGDQPAAIKSLTTGIKNDVQNQILLGVTGSGKTFTIANVIANLNRPALVLAHNKTLAAQLCAEFREFFPENAVDYFISYYDYYQPEAYIASRDVYIEKEAQINTEIERLRHHATRSLFLRRDIIIVASVSCIYGLGSPKAYIEAVFKVSVGQIINRSTLLNQLMNIHYERNDIELDKGRFRVNGDVIDLYPVWDEYIIRFELFDDEIERIIVIHPISGEVLETPSEVDIFPATHYIVGESLEPAIKRIQAELNDQIKYFNSIGKEFEAKRIEKRTKYDIEMMREMGYCKGIENYSRHIENRAAETPADVLLDFFPDDFITIIDESHVTIPQVKGMYRGDRSRKEALVDYGFRLPSAFDNRPLTFDEFENRINQTIYVSATPGPYEMERCGQIKSLSDLGNQPKKQNPLIVEQIIRPTGLVDPSISVRPTKDQIKDLINEATIRVKRNERVLVTTLTKKMSEELTEYLEQAGLKVQWLHSDIDALERIDILHNLRSGKYDVLVGVNLLREGLDLPEVSLVLILDADKEGFLRNERSLIQTMGRAARNEQGQVIMYADKITQSMDAAINETTRRRNKQLAYNNEHNIVPKTIKKKLTDIRSQSREEVKKLNQIDMPDNPSDLPKLIATLTKEMHAAAERLEFEVAATLRDKIENLQT